MLVPDIDVGRLLLINLELRDDKVSFHGVSYPILPHYLCPYQSQSRVSLQPSCVYASTSSKRGMATKAVPTLLLQQHVQCYASDVICEVVYTESV